MNRRAQHGAGLIEAMISIFVVSIGFLGYAGLQMSGLTAVNQSLFRSKAVYLSYQMTDRVRANLPGMANGSYNAMSGSGSDPGCISANCTPAQVAQNDFYEWSTEVAAALPAGQAAICLTSTPDACDGAAGGVYAITLSWTEKGTQHNFVTSFRP